MRKDGFNDQVQTNIKDIYTYLTVCMTLKLILHQDYLGAKDLKLHTFILQLATEEYKIKISFYFMQRVT